MPTVRYGPPATSRAPSQPRPSRRPPRSKPAGAEARASAPKRQIPWLTIGAVRGGRRPDRRCIACNLIPKYQDRAEAAKFTPSAEQPGSVVDDRRRRQGRVPGGAARAARRSAWPTTRRRRSVARTTPSGRPAPASSTRSRSAPRTRCTRSSTARSGSRTTRTRSTQAGIDTLPRQRRRAAVHADVAVPGPRHGRSRCSRGATSSSWTAPTTRASTSSSRAAR